MKLFANGTELADGVNNLDERNTLQIGVAYHVRETAYVTVKNGGVGKRGSDWVAEGQTKVIADIKIEHKRSVEG